jgi:hypothetical protein
MSYEDGVQRWRSPVADRLAEEVKRLGDKHPLLVGWNVAPDNLWLALKGVSAAAGRTAKQLEWRALPAGTAGVLPDEIWLDTGRPPEAGDTHLRYVRHPYQTCKSMAPKTKAPVVVDIPGP